MLGDGRRGRGHEGVHPDVLRRSGRGHFEQKCFLHGTFSTAEELLSYTYSAYGVASLCGPISAEIAFSKASYIRLLSACTLNLQNVMRQAILAEIWLENRNLNNLMLNVRALASSA